MHTKTKLWAHQDNMVAFARRALKEEGCCWWLAGCATGKTLATLKLIEDMGIQRTLVITQLAAIRSAWEIDIHKHTEGLHVVPLYKGSLKERAKRIISETRKPVVFVINYEAARKILPLIPPVQLLVADESHKLKTHNSAVSKAVTAYAQKVPYKIAMTGTPWEDRPTDVWGQVNWMNSEALGNWYAFFERHVIYKKWEKVKIPVGYKNLESLQRRIEPFTLHVSSDVLELPPVLEIERYVPMEGEMRRIYKDIENEMIAEYRGNVMVTAHLLTQSLRLHMLTGGHYVTEDGEVIRIEEPEADYKAGAVENILDEIGGEPTVIFTRFKSDVAKLKPRIEAMGLNVKLLTGDQHDEVEFQAGEGDVLIANIQSGSAGVNLSRARYCIFYSIGYSRTDWTQALARVRRPGSDLTKPITYWYIMVEGTIDEIIYKQLLKKGQTSKEMLEWLLQSKT